METGFDRPMGMHIRGTDSWLSKRTTNFSQFKDKIDALVSEDSRMKIFLCSDELELKRSIIDRHPDNILHLNARRRYEDGAMSDAVSELFLLSMCREIWGSNSGFSDLASSIGRTRLTVMQKSGESKVILPSEW